MPGRRVIAFSLLLLAAPAAAQSVDAEPGVNPLPFDVAAIKRGRAHYGVHCVTCHGVDGRGDTEMREFLKTAPAELTDEVWFYGGSDEILFDVIARGREERDMPGYADKLDDEQIWQVIHYLRFLGGSRP